MYYYKIICTEFRQKICTKFNKKEENVNLKYVWSKISRYAHLLINILNSNKQNVNVNAIKTYQPESEIK